MSFLSRNNKVKIAMGLAITASFALWCNGAEARTKRSRSTGSVFRLPSSFPSPSPTPAPAPAPAPSPAPVPSASYVLTISSPASGSNASGSIQIKGKGPGFLNVEVLTSSGSLLARTTPDSSGNFTATVDTTKLSNGSQTLTIDAWDSPAGQMFNHSDEKKLSLNVQNGSGSPAQSPAPAPTPVPAPAPSPAPAATYSLSISSPASGATIKGTVQIQGSGPGFLNVEVYSADGVRLAQVTPSSSGSFSASVDTTKLYNGSQSLTIYGWDSPAGQNFTHSDQKNLTVNVQNSGGQTAPSGGGGGATGGSATPVGGPGGYSKMVMNDSFGSSKAGANITSLGQFNQGTYGSNGSGWDDHMCAWDCGKANLSMASDHLEIRPTGGPSGFISSRYEFLPNGSSRIYYEIRAAVGRGDYTNGQTWPAFWLFAGNEPGSNNTQSEIDIMETYMSQQWGPYDNAAGGYAQHFVATIHPNANSSTDSWSMDTPGIDITTTMNTYGCEVWKDGSGKLQIAIYFNGKFMGQSSQGINWTASPPSLFLGWNPGSTSWSPAVMKVDYVKAWIK